MKVQDILNLNSSQDLNKKWVVFIFLISIALSFVVFGNTLDNPFLFDDIHLESNMNLYAMDNIGSIFSSPFHFIKSSLYRPVAMLSYAINRIFGDSPTSFRFFQVLMYGINGGLLFLVLNKLGFKKIETIVASVLFTVHPIHNEIINVIVFRTELLATGFGLWAMYLRLCNKNLLGVYLLFLLSLLSKETGLAIIAILLYFLLFVKQDEAMNLWSKIKKYKNDIFCSLGTISIFLGLRFLVIGGIAVNDPTIIVQNPIQHISKLQGIATAFKALGMYLIKLFYPKTLSIDYSFNQISAPKNIFDPLFILGILVLIIPILILIPKIKLSYKYKLSATFLFFPLILVSNLTTKIGSIFAERWLYIPSIGFSIIVAIILSWLLGKKKKIFPILSILIAILVVCFSITKNWNRNSDWKSGFSLYSSTAKASPNSVLARNNLGAMYLLEKDYQSAKEELEAATNIYSNYPQLLYNWGYYYQAIKDLKNAENCYLKTLEIDPEYIDAYSQLIQLYVNINNPEKAQEMAEIKFQKDSDIKSYNDFQTILKQLK